MAMVFLFDKFVRVLASVIKLSSRVFRFPAIFPFKPYCSRLFTDISVTCSILRTDWIPVISRYRLAVLLLSRGCDVLLGISDVHINCFTELMKFIYGMKSRYFAEIQQTIQSPD